MGSPIPVTYGGQAVIEGVLMRSNTAYAIAARRPDGTIKVLYQEMEARAVSSPVWRLPILRGMATLAEMVVLGMRAISWSAGVQLGEDVEIPPAAMGLTIAGSALFAVLLFVVLPFLVARGVSHSTSLASVLLEGLIRLLVLVAYLLLIGMIGSVGRLFQYHGAEHKAINGLEAGAVLEAEAVTGCSRLHPRCGTGFLVVVVVVSVIVFSPLTLLPIWERFLGELVLLPLVAGISYEGIRFLGRHRYASWAKVGLMPILGAQLLTTREPSTPQIEVAIAALARVLPSGATELSVP